MTIALIAHDAKKELMIQFCIAYCGILSKQTLCATGTTGKLVSEATGLHVERYLSGKQGGDQQIAARIACNEIDMVLFFRDPLTVKEHEPNEMALLRLCDVHNIPIGTRGFGLAFHRETLRKKPEIFRSFFHLLKNFW